MYLQRAQFYAVLTVVLLFNVQSTLQTPSVRGLGFGITERYDSIARSDRNTLSAENEANNDAEEEQTVTPRAVTNLEDSEVNKDTNGPLSEFAQRKRKPKRKPNQHGKRPNKKQNSEQQGKLKSQERPEPQDKPNIPKIPEPKNTPEPQENPNQEKESNIEEADQQDNSDLQAISNILEGSKSQTKSNNLIKLRSIQPVNLHYLVVLLRQLQNLLSIAIDEISDVVDTAIKKLNNPLRTIVYVLAVIAKFIGKIAVFLLKTAAAAIDLTGLTQPNSFLGTVLSTLLQVLRPLVTFVMGHLRELVGDRFLAVLGVVKKILGT